MKNISLFVLWNGFLSYISKSLLHRLKSNNRTCWNENALNNDNISGVVFWLPYGGTSGEQLLKHCLKKIRHCFKLNLELFTILGSICCNMKDKIPHE